MYFRKVPVSFNTFINQVLESEKCKHLVQNNTKHRSLFVPECVYYNGHDLSLINSASPLPPPIIKFAGYSLMQIFPLALSSALRRANGESWLKL